MIQPAVAFADLVGCSLRLLPFAGVVDFRAIIVAVRALEYEAEVAGLSTVFKDFDLAVFGSFNFDLLILFVGVGAPANEESRHLARVRYAGRVFTTNIADVRQAQGLRGVQHPVAGAD